MTFRDFPGLGNLNYKFHDFLGSVRILIFMYVRLDSIVEFCTIKLLGPDVDLVSVQ